MISMYHAVPAALIVGMIPLMTLPPVTRASELPR